MNKLFKMGVSKSKKYGNEIWVEIHPTEIKIYEMIEGKVAHMTSGNFIDIALKNMRYTYGNGHSLAKRAYKKASKKPW